MHGIVDGPKYANVLFSSGSRCEDKNCSQYSFHHLAVAFEMPYQVYQLRGNFPDGMTSRDWRRVRRCFNYLPVGRQSFCLALRYSPEAPYRGFRRTIWEGTPMLGVIFDDLVLLFKQSELRRSVRRLFVEEDYIRGITTA